MTQLQKRRLHLPHHSENLLYILALALSPIGNYLLHMLMLGQYQTTLGGKQVWLHGAIDISYALFIGGAIPALLILLLRTKIHRSADVRWLLGGFGIICILDLLLNVVIINLAILDNKSQSYLLLIQAFVLYLSTNLIFFFWYWFIDYPEQLRHLSDPTDLPDILFPEQSGDLVARWKPHPIDYLFFHHTLQQHPRTSRRPFDIWSPHEIAADRPHYHHLAGVSGAGGKGHQHPARPGNNTLS
jgi:hypothetical protein